MEPCQWTEGSAGSLLPLWRRPAHLHWHAVCRNGDKTTAGQHSPALHTSPGTRLPSRAPAARDPAPQTWHAHDVGSCAEISIRANCVKLRKRENTRRVNAISLGICRFLLSQKSRLHK